jgi:methionine synthase I (cobalamin-dependent)
MPSFALQGLSAPVILDGAWATELQGMGLELGSCADAWNLDHPELVQTVARSYVRAGSRIILTNTFGANREALSFYGMTSNVAEINRAGVRLSRAASNGQARVFASMGPSRKSLVRGEVLASALVAAFTEQACLLAEAGADALVLETFTDLDELQTALHAAKTTGLPVVACLVFLADTVANSRTTPETAARVLTDAGADAIGANCCEVSESLVDVCRRLRAVTDRPLWFKPNAGLPKVVNGQINYSMSQEAFVEGVRQLVEAGADMIGGCCGINSEAIHRIAQTAGPRGT